MIKYSLLDIPSISKDVKVENVTIRIDEGLFDGTIITYDPIQLVADGARISYGLVVKALFANGIDKLPLDGSNPSLTDVLSRQHLNKLYEHSDDIFIDVLKLMKNNINLGAKND